MDLNKEEKRLEKLLKDAIENEEYEAIVPEGKLKVEAINDDEKP